jgi:hypothetical protein
VGARATGWESLPDPRDRLTRKSILILSKNDAGVELTARSFRARGVTDVRWMCEVIMATPDGAWPRFLESSSYFGEE